MKCNICGTEHHLCPHVTDQITELIRTGKAQEQELKTLANTWKGIIKVLDLETANSQTIFLKIPRLIAQIQRQPEIFNFISPEISAIIEKYADK